MSELMTLLGSLSPVIGEVVSTWLVIFLRVGMAMLALPGLGETVIPMRVRLSVAVLVSLALLPGVSPQIIVPNTVFAEMAVGALLGLSLRFFVFAIITAGSIIANATSLSQLFPQDGEAQPAVSTLVGLAAVAGAFEAGLATQTVAYFMLTYDLFPIGQIPSIADTADWLSRHADEMFSLAFALSLPFVIASMIYNLALGVINKAMPALMVTFIGAPALSLGALVLLALAIPFLLQTWLMALRDFLETPFLSG